MNRNLFLKELQRNALSLVIWMIAIVLLISVTMSVYPKFVENQSKILGFFNLVPKAALQFKGISNLSDLTSVLGFYAVNNVIYMMLLGSVFAIVIGSNILLKEEYHKTAEYLLARPMTRSGIFFSKVSVAFLYVFLLNLVTALVGLLCMRLVQNAPFRIGSYLVLCLYTFLLNLLFGAAGLFISTLVRKPRPITTFSIGLVLIFYFINTIAKITESAEKIGYLSPFKYVRMDVMSPDYRLEFPNFVLFAGLSMILGVAAYRLYARKDIYT